jgi:hypothetical protein
VNGGFYYTIFICGAVQTPVYNLEDVPSPVIQRVLSRCPLFDLVFRFALEYASYVVLHTVCLPVKRVNSYESRKILSIHQAQCFKP